MRCHPKVKRGKVTIILAFIFMRMGAILSRKALSSSEMSIMGPSSMDMDMSSSFMAIVAAVNRAKQKTTFIIQFVLLLSMLQRSGTDAGLIKFQAFYRDNSQVPFLAQQILPHKYHLCILTCYGKHNTLQYDFLMYQSLAML